MSLQPPEQIATDRLLLRRVSVSDAGSLFASYASDPEATRFLSWPTHDSVDDMRRFLDYATTAWGEGADFVWAMRPKDVDMSLGTISFSKREHRAHLGFVIAKSEWNKGYMTEAARALVRWLEKQSVISRIEAVCDIENVGSQRVLERSGLEREGILRRWMVLPNLSQTPRDMYMYSKIL